MDQLRNTKKHFDSSLSEKGSEERELDAKLESKRAELAKVEEEIADKVKSLHMSHLIIDFLVAPNRMSNHDLDQLVRVMITLRQNRLGIKPSRVTDASGNVICECQVPKMYSGFDAEKVDIDHTREVFALCLAPLVKDRFVPRFDYDLAQFEHEVSEKLASVQATLEERRRHII